ncbi:MAG TPA: hypothetical protein DCM05_15210 [Elusimicrobia bacterium]|nr:hypothetical protein [Elusimicrobiota bacterium]
MSRVRSFLGYAWAALAVPIVLLTFLAGEPLSRALARSTGVIVSPWFSGGEVARTIEHGGYRTHVRRPVFDGLLGERRRGFIQVDWEPAADMPDLITEEVDAFGDGRVRFTVTIDTRTGKTAFADAAPEVLGLDLASRFKGGWAVRVALRNPGGRP